MARVKGATGPRVVAPRDKVEAEAWVLAIGEKRREVVRMETAMNDEIAAIKAEREEAARPWREDIEAMVEGVRLWASANRDELTDGGKRQSVELGTGVVAWRVQPPRVTIRGAEAVLAALKKLGLSRFIRTKEEINKDAMLAEPEVARLAPGITIGSAGESFSIEPFEADLDAAKA